MLKYTQVFSEKCDKLRISQKKMRCNKKTAQKGRVSGADICALLKNGSPRREVLQDRKSKKQGEKISDPQKAGGSRKEEQDPQQEPFSEKRSGAI